MVYQISSCNLRACCRRGVARAVALLLLSGCSISWAQEKPAIPVVEAASSEGSDAIGGFKKPQGWDVQLVAAEPEVANIVAFDIDGQGRFWICETFRQDIGVTDNRAHDERWLRADLAATSVQDRIDYHERLLGEAALTYKQQDDRIRLLTDTDGDGKLDKSQVFASGFNGIEEGTGASVLARGADVYYACIPRLWKITDKDGDGESDVRTALADGFGVRVAFRGHDLHGLIRGPDGRLYFSIGDRGYNIQTSEGSALFDPASGAIFRCEMDGSNLEVFATGLRNPQELAFDELGNLFSCDNNSDSGDQARWVYLVQGGDTGWRMSYQYFPNRGPFNREKIWHPFHEQQPAYIVPPVTNISDGPSGLMYYPGTGLGEEWNRRFLLADFRGTPANSGIRTFRVKNKGAFFELVDSEQPIWSVLATDVAMGPDGAIYVSDWVDGWVGIGKGRIYRFADPSTEGSQEVAEVRELLASDWSSISADRLQSLLGHKDQRIRNEAQWQLAERGEADRLRQVIQNTSLSRVNRLHGAWGLGQIQRTKDLSQANRNAIVALLDDGDAYLRSAAAELVVPIDSPKVRAKIRGMIEDADPRVRYFASQAIANLRDSEAFEGIVNLLDANNNEDPIIRHGCMMALVNIASSERLASLSDHENRSVRRVAAVALRRQQSKLVAEFLNDSDLLVVAEAARAINDAPINEAMPALAAFSFDRNGDADAVALESIIRRVLNANFRLGQHDNAVTVAKLAANAKASEAMRLEAIEMLAEWNDPDERDRVMNLWRPLAERREVEIAAVVEAQLGELLAGPKAVSDRTVELASALRIKKIAPQLIARIDNASLEASSRAGAVVALAKIVPEQALEIASRLLSDDASSLRIASMEVFAKLKARNLTKVLEKATKSGDARERGRAWDLLAASDADDSAQLIEAGLTSYIDGKLPRDVWLNVLEAADGRVTPDAKKRLAEAEALWNQSDPLASHRWALGGGDLESGRKLFFEKTELSCVRCHRVHRQGGQVGPVLTTIGKQRERKYLLEAIVSPDAAIAKGYETVIVVDLEGQVHNGIVREDNDEFLRLIKADGSEVTIPQDDIEVRRRGKSAMPADLIKHLSDRQLRDLVAYLESLKVDPRASSKEIE